MQDNTTYFIVIGAVVVALAALAALVNYGVSIVRGVQEMRHAVNPPRNRRSPRRWRGATPPSWNSRGRSRS